jgi:hypothetical protein
LWCVSRVCDLHVVIEDDAVVVVDDLALVTKLDRVYPTGPWRSVAHHGHAD